MVLPLPVLMRCPARISIIDKFTQGSRPVPGYLPRELATGRTRISAMSLTTRICSRRWRTRSPSTLRNSITAPAELTLRYLLARPPHQGEVIVSTMPSKRSPCSASRSNRPKANSNTSTIYVPTHGDRLRTCRSESRKEPPSTRRPRHSCVPVPLSRMSWRQFITAADIARGSRGKPDYYLNLSRHPEGQRRNVNH